MQNLPEKAVIRYSGVTGYGEKLIQTALNVDLNEIETIAHYTAAKKFDAKCYKYRRHWWARYEIHKNEKWCNR